MTVMFEDLVAGELDPSDEAAVDEVEALYRDVLVPQMVCAPDNHTINVPSRPWLTGPERFVATVRQGDPLVGRLVGCWVVENGGIFYPVVDVAHGHAGVVQVFRELALFSFDRAGGSLWASTINPQIHQWAQQMGIGEIRFSGIRMTWERPDADR